MKRYSWVGVAGIIIFLAGCGAGPQGYYRLSAAKIETGGVQTDLQLAIAEPAALKDLDTDGIAIIAPDGAMTYLKSHVWGDRLPRMLQARLVETLDSAAFLRAVAGSDTGALIPDYQLAGTLNAFEIRLGGAARAVISLSATLIDIDSGRALASRTFRNEAALSSTRPAGLIAALNAANEDMIAAIALWLRQNIRQMPDAAGIDTGSNTRNDAEISAG